MKKILITGGAGFIGSEIVNQLSATKKWLITVLDALTEQIHSNSPEESFLYGAGQSLKNPYTGILSIFSTLLLENKPINIFEDGLESRDFIHVKDIADGVIASLDNSTSNGETINLGSGINTTVIEIAETLKKTYNSRSKLNITGDFRIGDIAHNKADITKARTLLAFEPKITLEEGLEDFCNWVKKQGKGYIDYESSLTELATNGLLITK